MVTLMAGIPLGQSDDGDMLVNALYYGYNLDLLRNSRSITEDIVDLCYIDPPFNSKRRYNRIYNQCLI
jgi:hypothetical protein